MAIRPPSDLVLGSVLAADPAKYREAAERLQRAGAVRRAADPAGAAPPTSAERAARSPPPAAQAPPPPLPARSTPPRQSGKPNDTFAQLEAFVLQTFIQSMLPSGSQAFFGKGTSGEVWKSMLADKLGAELARSGQVGLARRLAAGRDAGAANPAAPAGAPPPVASAGPARAAASVLDALPYLRAAVPPPIQ